MDIIAQFFACFSQKLAPARKNSTDWSARSARFCNSAVIWIRVKKVITWVLKKMEYLDDEIDDNMDVLKDGHLDV